MPDDKANIVIHVYGGDRQLIAPDLKWFAKTIDGRFKGEEKTLHFPNLTGPSKILEVDYFANFGDLYTVFVQADGFDQMVWYPVHVNNAAPVELNIMLMPKDGHLQFANATWARLLQARSGVAEIIRRGCQSDDDAAKKYGAVQEKRPAALACLLNIMTALAPMRLPSGQSPLHYYWNIAWPQGDPDADGWFDRLDEVLAQDRFFCYVDAAILPDIRNGVHHGFSQEPNPGAWGHTGATESYKQTDFDIANVQLTFHGTDVATIDGVSCVKIEPDIDYYKDQLAHTLSEFIPNFITKQKTDPRFVYWLRWMNAKGSGMEFDPLFTVERQTGASAD